MVFEMRFEEMSRKQLDAAQFLLEAKCKALRRLLQAEAKLLEEIDRIRREKGWGSEEGIE